VLSNLQVKILQSTVTKASSLLTDVTNSIPDASGLTLGYLLACNASTLLKSCIRLSFHDAVVQSVEIICPAVHPVGNQSGATTFIVDTSYLIIVTINQLPLRVTSANTNLLVGLAVAVLIV